MNDSEELYKLKAASRIVDADERKIINWCEKKVVDPRSPADGTGHHRKYSAGNLFELRLVRLLSDYGYNAPQCKPLLRTIKELFMVSGCEAFAMPKLRETLAAYDAAILEKECQAIAKMTRSTQRSFKRDPTESELLGALKTNTRAAQVIGVDALQKAAHEVMDTIRARGSGKSLEVLQKDIQTALGHCGYPPARDRELVKRDMVEGAFLDKRSQLVFDPFRGLFGSWNQSATCTCKVRIVERTKVYMESQYLAEVSTHLAVVFEEVGNPDSLARLFNPESLFSSAIFLSLDLVDIARDLQDRIAKNP
ncbi:MAG: hypothetical protein HY694_12610 [Deltaproteobacteria bacterium]|nr:hypothetical protein [Deltaproteobacteria bacterium]